MGDNHYTILGEANQLVFDRTSDIFSRHPLTTDEIRENCRDLKVLGKKECKQLLKWREKMREFLKEVGSEGEEEGGEEGDRDREVEDDLEKVNDKVKALADKENADVKRSVSYNICGCGSVGVDWKLVFVV